MPCATVDTTPGINGATAAGLQWTATPVGPAAAQQFSLGHPETKRCLGTRA